MPAVPTQYPVYPGAVNPLPDPMEFSRQSHDILNNAVPGLDKLTSGATGVVNNLLEGLPSAGPTQRANAYYGASSGMPGSDFVRNRGFDLYQEKADSYKQRGFDDFLALLKGASGTIAPTPGEQLQNTQFDRNLQQRQVEANQQVGQFNANYNKGDQFDTSAWSSDDDGTLRNRAGQSIRNDPSFRRNRSILF